MYAFLSREQYIWAEKHMPVELKKRMDNTNDLTGNERLIIDYKIQQAIKDSPDNEKIKTDGRF